MSIRSDHKALIFIGAIAVLGAGVRVVRAATRDGARGPQPALEHQMQAADSAAKAGKGGARSRVHTTTDSTRRRRRGGVARATNPDSVAARRAPADRKGYVNGKLDLDVATAAQLDSIPGISATMAKRIVADRMQRGPFLNLERLRRVSGVGPAFLRKIDSLVMFSGTVVRPNPADTIIPKSRRR